MAAQQEEQEVLSWGQRICCCVVLIVIAGLVTLSVLLGTAHKDPVYSVTVTGVAGLDDLALAANPSLSPVFNLTVRIDNAGNLFESACIGRLSTVSVSYGDAVLGGRGSVPQFCAEPGKVRERGARAWAKDVDLPQFLRDQLAGELAAGEASIDVKVTTPAAYYMVSDTVLVCIQAKIGGGPATCQKESVYQHANPGFTSS